VDLFASLASNRHRFLRLFLAGGRGLNTSLLRLAAFSGTTWMQVLVRLWSFSTGYPKAGFRGITRLMK